MTYVPSRKAEIDAMIAMIDAGGANLGTDASAPAAATDGPVSVDGEHVAAGELGEAFTALRDYVDSMEHVRQNRLHRWQTPPITSRSER
jgi:hypothetical protein